MPKKPEGAVAIRRVYLLPNMITTFSLACGLFVIFRMSLLTPGVAAYPVVLASSLLLIVAAIADTLDGAAARLIRAESDFGSLFDCLSDAITFGVAPAVLALKSLTMGPESQVSILASTSAMLFAICGVLRLVRYGVAATSPDKKSKRRSSTSALRERSKGRTFEGLPIPTAAGTIVSTTLLLAWPPVQAFLGLSEKGLGLTLAIVMIVAGYLMVSRVRFPALRMLNVRLWSYNLIFLTVILAVGVFYGILHFFPVMFALLVWGYITLAMGLNLFRAFRRKSKITTSERADSQPSQPK